MCEQSRAMSQYIASRCTDAPLGTEGNTPTTQGALICKSYLLRWISWWHCVTGDWAVLIASLSNCLVDSSIKNVHVFHILHRLTIKLVWKVWVEAVLWTEVGQTVKTSTQSHEWSYHSPNQKQIAVSIHRMLHSLHNAHRGYYLWKAQYSHKGLGCIKGLCSSFSRPSRKFHNLQRKATL